MFTRQVTERGVRPKILFLRPARRRKKKIRIGRLVHVRRPRAKRSMG